MPDSASTASNRENRRRTLILLGMLCLASALLHLWGIRRDLPYVHDYDEQPFVIPAYAMAVTGGWNPHWFGHPGSTMIYPLRVIDSAWIALAHGGADFQASSAGALESKFDEHAPEFFLLGRLLSIAYSVACVPLIFVVGRRVFGERCAWGASVIWMGTPLVVAQAQITRSDSSAMFFGFLALGLCVRLLSAASLRTRCALAAAVAAAVSSHYRMAFLAPLWLMAEWRIRNTTEPRPSLARWLQSLAVPAVVGMAVFGALNPFLFSQMATLQKNLASQTPSIHPGASGLSPAGNLVWYLRHALPSHFGWLPCLGAAAGAVLAFRRGDAARRLVVWFLILHLLVVIWSPLHWARWMTVTIPAAALLACHALETASMRFRRPTAAFVAGVCLLALPLYHELIFQNIRNSSFNTRMQALQWVRRNIPPGATIAYEWYTAPLRRERYRALEIHALPARGGLSSYRSGGFQYLMVSDNMRNRFLAEPEKFEKEVRFYNELESQAECLARFTPSRTVGGGEIRIYALKRAASGAR